MKILGYVRRSIFLSLKEILNNIVRHSKATEVTIRIEQVNQSLKITIEDNGVGLTKDINTGIVNLGNGLSNIKNSIAKLGGTVNYLIKNGTIIILKIPI